MSEEVVERPAQPGWTMAIEDRRKRADFYFQNVLNGQREWFSRQSGKQKGTHLSLAIVVILLGALISILPLWNENVWIPKLTAICGSLVAVLRALDTLLRPGETWRSYRKASEGMKREYRLYVNNADVYANAGDEDTAYRLLVTRVETIVAEEQQLFWKSASAPPKRDEA